MRQQFGGTRKGDRAPKPPRITVKRDDCLPPVAAGEVPVLVPPKRRGPRKSK